MLDKMGDECRNRLAPLTQRRHHDRGRIEAVEKIVAELTRLDHRTQVAIGRCDQANINRIGTRRPDRLNLMRLDRAQQFGLQAQRQLADLVQEQGPAVGRSEIAERILARVGKRAAHVPEQLRLGQRLDQVRAVEGHERAARAPSRAYAALARPAPCRCRTRRESARLLCRGSSVKWFSVPYALAPTAPPSRQPAPTHAQDAPG